MRIKRLHLEITILSSPHPCNPKINCRSRIEFLPQRHSHNFRGSCVFYLWCPFLSSPGKEESTFCCHPLKLASSFKRQSLNQMANLFEIIGFFFEILILAWLLQDDSKNFL